jgi:integrase
MLACGLRRHEAVHLEFGHIQQREEHWAIIVLKGKAGHTRTIPMPGWVKALLDDWLQAANLTAGKLFRRVNKNGKVWGEGLSSVVWIETCPRRNWICSSSPALRSWPRTISLSGLPT